MSEQKETTYRIEEGALVDVPVYEARRRGKNWLAVIEKDPKAPGGFARRFCEKARGNYYYLVDGLKVHDAVEFGADYYSSSGNKVPCRRYGVVLSITDNELRLLQCESGAEAIETSRNLKGDKEPLLKAKAELLKRLAELQSAISSAQTEEDMKNAINLVRRIEL